MKTLREQLHTLRLDMVVSNRCNDTERLMENMNEIADIINKTRVRDLDLSILDKLIYISLRRKLQKLINATCKELKQKGGTDAEDQKRKGPFVAEARASGTTILFPARSACRSVDKRKTSSSCSWMSLP